MATVPVDGPALGPGNRWLWGVDPSSLALARVGLAGGGTGIARRIMVQREIGMAEAFTPPERDLIRREFMIKGIGWSQPGYLARGIWLRRWASGPLKGRPKVSKIVQGLLDRGLVAIVDPERGFPAAVFTPAGLDALRAMAGDHRQLDPVKYAHLREELGLAPPETIATGNTRE